MQVGLPSEPAGATEQVPSKPGNVQVRQEAVQAVSQQKLSTQLSLTHSSAAVHDWPSLRLQAPAPSQLRPAPQLLSGSVPAVIGAHTPLLLLVDRAAVHA
jgi:hypothetical protein